MLSKKKKKKKKRGGGGGVKDILANEMPSYSSVRTNPPWDDKNCSWLLSFISHTFQNQSTSVTKAAP